MTTTANTRIASISNRPQGSAARESPIASCRVFLRPASETTLVPPRPETPPFQLKSPALARLFDNADALVELHRREHEARNRAAVAARARFAAD